MSYVDASNSEPITKRSSIRVAEALFETLRDYDLLNERGKKVHHQLWVAGWKKGGSRK